MNYLDLKKKSTSSQQDEESLCIGFDPKKGKGLEMYVSLRREYNIPTMTVQATNKDNFAITII